MSWHLLVHYLCDFRHDLAFAWVWTNWIGNITAGIVVAAVASFVWPKLRHRLERWWHREMDKHLAKHLEPLHARIDHVHAHIEAATGTPQPKVEP